MRFLLAAVFVWLAWRAVKATPRGRALVHALTKAFQADPPPTDEQARRVLGVGRAASPDDIRRAYRSLAKQHHPDVVPEAERPDAEQRMLRIQRAYEVLGGKR